MYLFSASARKRPKQPSMSATPLTIRNLTSTPVELKLVERYEAPSSPEPVGGFANITSWVGNATAPTHSQLAENAQSFGHQDVSVHVEPFQTTNTDIKPREKSESEIVRFTFEFEGEKYRLDIPTPGNTSTTLTPLIPNPRFHYTAVFLPQSSYLTLLSSAALNRWMRQLKNETPLAALSIPGTHNSPTHHKALPSVRCQAVSVREQLNNGVRFLDIRVQVENPDDLSKDGLILVHSVFPISLTGTKYFRHLVNDVEEFLRNNPSETVIMSVKREGVGKGTDANLSRILRDHYAGDVNSWFTAPRVPTLGESRGKIVLMRRFTLEESLHKEWDGAGWCINAETWADNTPNDTCPSGAVCVQDFYEVLETENIEKKIELAQHHFERAAACEWPLPGITTQANNEAVKMPIYLNFLSASNFWKVGCWPEKIAAKLNPAIVDFLCRRHNTTEGIATVDANKKPGGGSTGIVVCDWVGHNGDWDLVRCIVGMNGKLELRERSL